MTEQEKSQPTPMPVQAVEADKLPRESGWSYKEICNIVGNLYLDSYHRVSNMEEEFESIINDYQSKLMQMQAEIEKKNSYIEDLNSQVIALKKELEHGRQKSNPNIAPNPVR